MAFINFKEAKTIWGLPVLIFWITSIVWILLFIKIITVYPNIAGRLELALTFTLFSLFLITWFVVRLRYERVKQTKIRKTLQWTEKLFIAVFLLCVLRLLWEFLIH